MMKTIIPIAPMGGMRTSGIIASRPTAESLGLQEPPESIPEEEEEKKDIDAQENEDALEGQTPPTQPTAPSPLQHPVAQLPSGKPAKECDYDTNPSELYLSIQSKRWPDTVARTVSHPEEASTWVSRKERDGKLRWRLLPLHAAIIFKAPEKAVESLLCSFPPGAQCKDDQGMLPIHLAFRNGSSEGVVNLLLVAYPQSIDVKDRKGRIPLTLAQASTSPNREAFIRAIERGPRYYAVAAAATERSVLTSEQKSEYEDKISKMQKDYEEKLAEAGKDAAREAEEVKSTYDERIVQLQGELEKSQETSQVLVDHVNSLEAQLSTRSDTERFLATKIANLDASLRETTAAKIQQEKELSEENRLLREENQEMKMSLETVEKDNAEVKSRALFFEESTEKEKQMTQAEKLKYEESIKSLQMELVAARTGHAAIDAQLKKKVGTEATLASQVSELASKLADSAAQSEETMIAHAEQTRKLEEEKQELQAAVEDLTAKLLKVSTALDFMATEQERIVSAAKRHEETMSVAAEAQRQIIANTARQEVIIAEATREREQIVSILQRQAEEAEKTKTERRLILEAVQRQHGEMERANKERSEIIDSVARQRKSMKDVKRTQLVGLPGVDIDDSDDELSVAARDLGEAGDDCDENYDDYDEEGATKDYPYPKISLTLTGDSSVCSTDNQQAGITDEELAAVDEKVRLALEAHSRVEEELNADRKFDKSMAEVVVDEVISQAVDPEAGVDDYVVSEEGAEEDVAEEEDSLDSRGEEDGEAVVTALPETKSGEVNSPTSPMNNTTVFIGATDETTNSMEVVGSVSHTA